MNKKKFISGFMGMTLALSAIGGISASAADTDHIDSVGVGMASVYIHHSSGIARVYARGDINKDGKVNATDLSKLSAHVKGIKPITDPESLYIADINADTYIDVKDISALAAYIKGIKPLAAPKNCVLYEEGNWIVD
jgi:hypothetical protein